MICLGFTKNNHFLKYQLHFYTHLLMILNLNSKYFFKINNFLPILIIFQFNFYFLIFILIFLFLNL